MLHIELQEPGVYELTYDALVAQQPALGDCASADLRLTQRGNEVPIRIEGDKDGKFRSGSRIAWVGTALHGPQSWFDQYSNTNVYQLSAAPGVHARIRDAAGGTGTPSALTRSVHFEQENLMVRLGDREMKHGDEPDVWLWAKMTPVDPKPFEFDFDLADLDTHSGADVSLTVNFRGESNVNGTGPSKPADHVVEVSVNAQRVQTLTWDGRDELRKTLQVPRALFKASGNKLSLRVPRRTVPTDKDNFIVDVVLFNWAQVAYPARGDFDASMAPFTASSGGSVEFYYFGQGKPGLLGSDGIWRSPTVLGEGHYRAAAAERNVDLYPFVADELRQPDLVRAVADSDLRGDEAGYDYLMVAHPRLREAVEPLAQYHRDHGLKVAVVNVDDIYDQFNSGIVHPKAIRDLVAWGTQHWQTKPRYLLLVGDASVDIHHDIRNGERLNTTSFAPNAHLQANEVMVPGGFIGMATTKYSQWDPNLSHRNLIPTWQVPSSSQGQSASDNDFVALKEGDFHPQLAVGRFPVVQPEEVEAIVKKTIAYQSKPTPGGWRHDMTFISSSEVNSFKSESDQLAVDLEKQGFAVNNVYTDVNDKNPDHAKALRARLRQDLDEGSLLVHFLGHGGSYIWRLGAMGDLFALDDVSAMKNAGRYPMVLAMTCFSAPFDNPVDDSIGERFLREPDKGAVAVFAASWSNWPNPRYSREVIEQLLKPGMTIGDAIVAAKKTITDRTFVEMYNLLGDPALKLVRPSTELQMVATADPWNKQVQVRIPGASDFGGTVDVDWADANGQIIQSRRYESRDRQFRLPIIDKAQQVIVYTTDQRNGAGAFGAYSVPVPPKPAAVVAPVPKPKQPAVAPVQPAPQPVAAGDPARKSNRHLPDRIARLGFDAPQAVAKKSSSSVNLAAGQQ